MTITVDLEQLRESVRTMQVWQGEEVRRRRRELGLSQTDLALAVGRTQTSIGRIERGGCTVSTELQLGLACALGLGVEDLWDVGDPGRFRM